MKDFSDLSNDARAYLVRVGEALRRAREQHGETVDQVAAFLCIKPAYIEAIESGDYTVFPARPYAFGFLRSYADYLGFDGPEVVRRIRDALEAVAPHPQLEVRKPIVERHRPTAFALVAAALVLGLGYLGWYGPIRLQEPIWQKILELPRALVEGTGVFVAPAPPAAPPEPAAPATAGADIRLAALDPAPQQPPLGGTAAVTEPVPGPRQAVLVRFQAVDDAPPVISHRLSAIETAGGDGAPTEQDATAANAAELSSGLEGNAERAPGARTDSAEALAWQGAGAADTRATRPRAARIELVATGDNWVRIESRDRSYRRSHALSAGERLPLPAREDLLLSAADGGRLEIHLDGRRIGTAGATGRPVHGVPLRPASLRAQAELAR